jgi:hypothetical protein
MSGSAKAAVMSRARAGAGAPSTRVVGYSTGTRPSSSRNRLMLCSCKSGKIWGSPAEGDNTATLSPGRGFAGYAGVVCSVTQHTVTAARAAHPSLTPLLAVITPVRQVQDFVDRRGGVSRGCVRAAPLVPSRPEAKNARCRPAIREGRQTPRSVLLTFRDAGYMGPLRGFSAGGAWLYVIRSPHPRGTTLLILAGGADRGRVAPEEKDLLSW